MKKLICPRCGAEVKEMDRGWCYCSACDTWTKTSWCRKQAEYKASDEDRVPQEIKEIIMAKIKDYNARKEYGTHYVKLPLAIDGKDKIAIIEWSGSWRWRLADLETEA